MKKLIFIFLLLILAAVKSQAQNPSDTLFVHVQSGRWVLFHILQKGETLADIGERFNILPQKIATENGVAFGAAIVPGLNLRIPLSPRNLTNSFSVTARPVFFRCIGVENLTILASSIGRTLSYLQQLNPGLKPYCSGNDTRILLGYLKRPAARSDEMIPEKDAPLAPLPDTPAPIVEEVPAPKPPEANAEAEFEDLVARGAPLNHQTGPIAFFQGGNGTVYYAFHNTAPHGTIVRFRNPANKKVVYAKVIGKLPVTKQYYKAAAAVSNNARRALGSLGDARMWCEIEYVGY